jgi:uncharacterized protein
MRPIKDILFNQKKELEIVKTQIYIRRDTEIKNLDNNLIKVIIGPRRVGKSFLVLHSLKNFAYVNFDDEDLINLINQDEIIDNLKEIYGNFKYLFLDEIQNLDRWELFVNRLQREGFNLIISGSNSNLLSNELSTHLTGRYLQTIVFPFSFKEYLRYFKSETESEIKSKLNTYLETGGYPEIIVKNLEDSEYLKLLYDSIIFKDIVKRYNIRNSKKLEELSRFLLNNISNLFSYNKIKNTLSFDSVNTVKEQIKFLEETFLFFELKKFSFKIKEQDNSNKKIYLIDNGFFKKKSLSLTKDYGRLYENLVAIKLKYYELVGKINFFYYKDTNNYEIDFLIKRDTKIISLIQVCFDITDIETKKREMRALISASKDLKCNDLIIITSEYEGVEDFSWYSTKRKIRFIPLHNFLIGDYFIE